MTIIWKPFVLCQALCQLLRYKGKYSWPSVWHHEFHICSFKQPQIENIKKLNKCHIVAVVYYVVRPKIVALK